MPTIASLPVGPTGYGLMGLTWRPTPTPQPQAFAAMRAALSTGANFWNGGEFYGPPTHNSLHLLRDYFHAYPADASRVVLSIKGGALPGTLKMDASPANITRSIDECVRLLDGTHAIDLFQIARIDPAVPVEAMMRSLATHVATGRIRAIGLSEVRAETIRRAHAVHPVAAVEVELSLWTPNPLHNGVAAACAELGITLVAYSPLATGALTDTLGSADAVKNLPDGDMRKHSPRFSPEVVDANMRLGAEVAKLADRKGCSKAQLALAWVRCLSGRPGLPTIIPIPGATTEARVRENGVVVELSDEEMEEIGEILEANRVVGERFPPHVPVDG